VIVNTGSSKKLKYHVTCQKMIKGVLKGGSDKASTLARAKSHADGWLSGRDDYSIDSW
jgi:hypothetical protein